MLQQQPFSTHLAWSFTHVLPGTFKRNRPEMAHLDFPILGPLPVLGTRQRSVEGGSVAGPFIYFVTAQDGTVMYVGKSKEQDVLRRWIRPGNGGPATHYWTHSIKSGGCVFHIARGLQEGQGPFALRFTSLQELRRCCADALGLHDGLPEDEVLERAEQQLIAQLRPVWNRPSANARR